MRTFIYYITVLTALFAAGCSGQYKDPYDSPYFNEQLHQQQRSGENINRQLQGTPNPNYWQERRARQQYQDERAREMGIPSY